MIYRYIAYCLIGLFLIAAKIVYDELEDIDKKKWVPHSKEIWVVAALLIIAMGFIFGFTKYALMAALPTPFVWALLFDLGQNDYRDKPLGYIGEITPESSAEDIFLSKIGNWQFPIKLGLIALSFYCNHLIYIHL